MFFGKLSVVHSNRSFVLPPFIVRLSYWEGWKKSKRERKKRSSTHLRGNRASEKYRSSHSSIWACFSSSFKKISGQKIGEKKSPSTCCWSEFIRLMEKPDLTASEEFNEETLEDATASPVQKPNPKVPFPWKTEQLGSDPIARRDRRDDCRFGAAIEVASRGKQTGLSLKLASPKRSAWRERTTIFWRGFWEGANTTWNQLVWKCTNIKVQAYALQLKGKSGETPIRFPTWALLVWERFCLSTVFDWQALRSGVMTILPGHDKEGRSVLYFAPRLIDYKEITGNWSSGTAEWSVHEWVVAFYYLLERSMEDENTQLFGMTAIINLKDFGMKNFKTDAARQLLDMMQVASPLLLTVNRIVSPFGEWNGIID